MKTCRKPVIAAAVAGYALGGGWRTRDDGDFIIAADTAQFSQPDQARHLPGADGNTSASRAPSARPRRWTYCLTARM